MVLSLAAIVVAGLIWAVLGYSPVFSPGLSVIGDLTYAFLRGVDLQANGTIPHLLSFCY